MIHYYSHIFYCFYFDQVPPTHRPSVSFLFSPVRNHSSYNLLLSWCKGKGERDKNAKAGAGKNRQREQRHSRLADKYLLPPSPLTLQSNQSSLLHDTQIPPLTRLCLALKHTTNEKACSFLIIGWCTHPSA